MCHSGKPARRCIGKTFLESSVCEDLPLARASRDTGHLPAPARQALYFFTISTKIGTCSGFRRHYLLNFFINVYCTFEVGAFPVHKSMCLKLSFLILFPMHSQALEKYNIEKDIAAFIKKEFDKKYNPTWHCIVGRNFGSYVTHETKHFIYFYLGQVAVLLFKSG